MRLGQKTQFWSGSSQSGEQATRSVVPMMTGAARMNMELASLAGRRAQAYLNLPNVVAQCRGPQDLFAAQARFWQTALEDYSACNRRDRCRTERIQLRGIGG